MKIVKWVTGLDHTKNPSQLLYPAFEEKLVGRPRDEINRAWQEAEAEYMPHEPDRQRLHNLWRHADNHGRFGGCCNVVEALAAKEFQQCIKD